MPFSVPVGEEEDGGAMASFSGGKQLRVDGVVFRPGRFDEAGEGENVFAVEAVIGGGRGGVPPPARFDRFAGVLADECSGIGVIGCIGEVLEAPMESLDATIVVGGPAAVAVAWVGGMVKTGRWVAAKTLVIITVFSFLFGIIVGSFLNVCITRIPEGVSIVTPGSRCPRCGTPIKPYDNVPIFAWMWLRGKCRACSAPISAMYPTIELATGLLFVGAFLEFGITQATVKWLFFTCLLVILIVTDLRVRLLPDVVNWPGLAAGLLFSAFVPPEHGFAGVLIERLLQVRLPGFA